MSLADSQPNKCYQAFPGANLANPFRVSEGTSLQLTKRSDALEIRQTPDSGSQPQTPAESEDCLFLKCVDHGHACARNLTGPRPIQRLCARRVSETKQQLACRCLVPRVGFVIAIVGVNALKVGVEEPISWDLLLAAASVLEVPGTVQN